METTDTKNFNQVLRERTFNLSVAIYDLLAPKKVPLTCRSAITQLLRCSSSVAANYRSATRARSEAEFISKICIVLEECDEMQHWVEFLIKVNVLSEIETRSVRDEIDQLLRIFSTSRKKLMLKKS
jgi:four helix bundle protein